MANGSSRDVLVLAPHPDDETFGCGGTIRHLANHGATVDVAFMTRGEQGFPSGRVGSPAAQAALAEQREREGRAACELLGVANVHFLGGSDGRLAHQPEMATAISRLLTQRNFARVLCPWGQDNHLDHRATYHWLRQALAASRVDCDVWLYEVWSPLPPNLVLPIDATMPAKLAAIDVYRSQLQCLNYRQAFVGLAAYRGLLCPPAGYAEAFVTCEGGALPEQ